MKRLVLILGLVFVAVVGWRIADRLSADALGMAVGVMFGVLAGIPTALMMLANSRRRNEYEDSGRPTPHARLAQQNYGYGVPNQPPVIILTANPQPGHPAMQQGYPGYETAPRHALPVPREQVEARKYRVVGEKDEWIEEW